MTPKKTIEIIPAILETNLLSIQEKIKLVEPYVDLVQLDIMDGRFVPDISYYNPQNLSRLQAKCNFELHLMIERPDQSIKDWLWPKVKKIAFHLEAVPSLGRIKRLIRTIKKAGKQAGVALSPAYDLSIIQPFIKDLDFILVMTVNPGFAGQGFRFDLLDKIAAIRGYDQNIDIEVDGGINELTAPEVVRVGANIIITCSYIFQQEDVGQAVNNLREAIKDIEPIV